MGINPAHVLLGCLGKSSISESNEDFHGEKLPIGVGEVVQKQRQRGALERPEKSRSHCPYAEDRDPAGCDSRLLTHRCSALLESVSNNAEHLKNRIYLRLD